MFGNEHDGADLSLRVFFFCVDCKCFFPFFGVLIGSIACIIIDITISFYFGFLEQQDSKLVGYFYQSKFFSTLNFFFCLF